MRRADRLFQIVQILRTRRSVTAQQIADKLEVSVRTVYRDVQDLLVSGVPIEGEAGVGYALRKGYDLPPLMFTREEINALAFGARIVQSWADSKLAEAATSALERIQLVLPDKLSNSMGQTHLYSPMIMIAPEVDMSLRELRGAIDARRKVKFHYTRLDGKQSERVAWPLGLFFWRSVWTLGTWCELREELRNFRVDRISQLEILGQTYTPQPGRTVEELMRCGEGEHA